MADPLNRKRRHRLKMVSPPYLKSRPLNLMAINRKKWITNKVVNKEDNQCMI
jgi:hypothetical protein